MLRTIRSYVRRQGRITPKQSAALNEGWSLYGVSTVPGILDLKQIFGRDNPKVLEIGFGMGSTLAEMARREPGIDFLGIEVHRPGLGALLALMIEQQLKNIRLIEGDAAEILKQFIADQSFDKIQIFFPDPWPKKRHHKRRLIQAEFIHLLYTKLKPKGILHIATDWQDYANSMMEDLDQVEGLKNVIGKGAFAVQTDRPLTKFEQRGKKLGHEIWDLLFVKAY